MPLMCGKAPPFRRDLKIREAPEGRAYKYFVPDGAKIAINLSAHQPAEPLRFQNLMPEINSQETIARILDECRIIAVVGLSSSSWRPSHGVAGYMQRAGYRIIPVNPNETSVLGQTAYARLKDVPDKIDLVDVFRRSEEAGAAIHEAIAVGAKAVWLQEGVIDQDAAQRAFEAGLLVVTDRCWLKEHARRKA